MNYLLYCVYKIILIIQDDEKKNTESKEKLRKKKNSKRDEEKLYSTLTRDLLRIEFVRYIVVI